MYKRSLTSGPRVRLMVRSGIIMAVMGWTGLELQPAARPAIASVVASRETQKAEEAVQLYLHYWLVGNYHGMYEMIAPQSQSKYSRKVFVERVRNMVQIRSRPMAIIWVRCGDRNDTLDGWKVRYRMRVNISKEHAQYLLANGVEDAKPGPKEVERTRVVTWSGTGWRIVYEGR